MGGNKLKKKIIGILVVTLLIATAILVASSIIQNNEINKTKIKQSYNNDVIEMIQQLDETIYLGYLEDLVAFGPRVTGTTECEVAGEYIYI